MPGLPVGELSLFDFDRVGQVLGEQVGVRILIEERLDLRPPAEHRHRRALAGATGLRWQTESFPVGGGDEGAGVDGDIAAAQPDELRERHPGHGED